MAKVPKNPQTEIPEGLAFELVVTEEFAGHRIGDVITDQAEVSAVMQKYPGHFTKRAKSV